MINRKFLNFKTYNGFLTKKNAKEIPDDSIVFIQDRHCIWARGKEYICDGPYTSSVLNGLLTFRNGDDTTIFTISLLNGTIEFVDQNGVETRVTYVLDEDFQNAIQDVINRIPIVDSQLSSTSTNPVYNKAIYNKLLEKVDIVSLDNYVLTNTYEDDKRNVLQEKLYEGDGIDIYRESSTSKLKIKSTLDTNVYLIVDSIESVDDPNPNKIYLVETMNQDGTYRYMQYRYRNGQWVSFDAVMPNINLSGFETTEDASLEHEAIWNAINAIDLTPYAKIKDHIDPIYEELNDYALTEWVLLNFAPIEDYATRKYVDDTFVKKEYVYNPKLGDWGTDSSSEGGGIVINPSVQLITIDQLINQVSPNPVANWVIYTALLGKANSSDLSSLATRDQLNLKANRSELDNYITNSQLIEDLALKLNILRAGFGISIVDDTISSTLDTEPFVIVDDLPTTNISNNKIYIVETINGNQRTYEQWKHTDDPLHPWISLGIVVPEVNLSGYYTRQEAEALQSTIGSTYLTKQVASQDYQPKGNYATKEWILENYQEQGNYVTLDTLTDVILNISETYLTKGPSYVTSGDVSAALEELQEIIDEKYVLKKDVYEPENSGFSTSDPIPIIINPSTGGDSDNPGGGNSNNCNCDHNIPKLVTLTVAQYEQLIEEGTVSADTYYFTYEGEPEPENNETWHFGDGFPIILTDGSTPDSIGTFPINLV